jgi:hypothetical protein
MNYQIQGLSILRRCTGLQSRLSYFSITGGGTSRTWRKVIWGNKRAFIRAWFGA